METAAAARPAAPSARPSLLAGVAAGQIGAVSFWTFHTLWISDVPAVLAEGVAWGLAAGAATGWAFHHLHEHGGIAGDARGAILLGSILWILLVPYELLGLALGPSTHLTRPAELAAFAPVGALGALGGALVGWALTHHVRATVALALAGLLAHFMVGSSLAYFGGRGTLLLLFLWMLPTYLAAAFVYVRVRARLLAAEARRRHPQTGPDVIS